jgi:isocitrate lyase
MKSNLKQIRERELSDSWQKQERWAGVQRNYTPEQVLSLQGSLKIEHTIASYGAERLWKQLQAGELLSALGALSGAQAVQQVKAGLEAIYVSGWQVAADANSSGETFPDQSLYPVNSVPLLITRINKALQRADQIAEMEQASSTDFFVPIIADAEAGFGGSLNAYELMRAMVIAGAAGVHFEDQVAAEKKCGHLGGKVLVPTQTFIRTLNAARLASDVLGVPTVLIARTDAESAKLITSDCDERDIPFIEQERTAEGYFSYRGGEEAAIARGLAYAPYADLLWWETSKPCLKEAERFAAAIHAKFPNKILAYNCSPSFNWITNLTEHERQTFQKELCKIGYKFQFVTLAGYHTLNYSMFDLAHSYKTKGMSAYASLQAAEFSAERHGYSAVRHQQEVGTGYYDRINSVLSAGKCSTNAMHESTEQEQFSEAGSALEREEHVKLANG